MLRCSRSGVLLRLYWPLAHPGRCISVWYTIWLWGRFATCDGEGGVCTRVVWGWGCDLSQSLAHEGADILARLNRSKARNGAGIGKVPLVFGNADKVANGGVAGPGAPQRCLGEFERDARLQESTNVAAGRNAVDWRQAGEVDCGRGRPLLAFGLSAGNRAAWGSGRRRRRRIGRPCAAVGLLALEPRPTRQKWLGAVLRPRHGARSPFPPRLGAGLPWVSRRRLKVGRSTWCWAMKASTAAMRLAGIGTVSIRSLPASAKASPSAGSAVTACTA